MGCWFQFDASDLRVPCDLRGVLGSRSVERDRANLKSDYRADDIWVDGKRFHLRALTLHDEVSPSTLKRDFRSPHKGVVGGLRLGGDAVCRKVYLVVCVLNRLCVITATWEGKCWYGVAEMQPLSMRARASEASRFSLCNGNSAANWCGSGVFYYEKSWGNIGILLWRG
jgi:hypothetical protein